METSLKAPFPWYGGKSRAAPLIWSRLGHVSNVVIPFYGSGAELLGCPYLPEVETVNDLDGFIANVWRALEADPDAVAQWCDRPVNEVDLHAIHLWLVQHHEEFLARLMGDPFYYDAHIAGWWLWGICSWIGSGWCSGEGPWHSVKGQLARMESVDGMKLGVNRKRPHLSREMGVHRQLPHLGTTGSGVHRKRPHLSDAEGEPLQSWFRALQARLRRVRVCCGDYSRVLGPSVTWNHGLTAIIFDPPYATEEDRDMTIYRKDSGTVAHEVRAWCLAEGSHPLLRIALCGYEGTHDVLLDHGWTKEHWSAQGGYGNMGSGRGRANAQRETIWFSPHCPTPTMSQLPLL